MQKITGKSQTQHHGRCSRTHAEGTLNNGATDENHGGHTCGEQHGMLLRNPTS